MKYLLYSLFLVSYFACNSEGNQTSANGQQEKSTLTTPATVDCKYGQPVAIFSEELPQITKQSFELIGQKGIETVTFTDGNILELYQSGCNEVRQEYRFFLTGNYKEKADSFWFEQAIARLTFVGQLDDRYAVIGMWVGAIEQLIDKMTIGQFTEAEPDTFIMVDKIEEEESAIIIIVLERRI
ncbi:MAG: hypothetical protein ACI8P3_002053 [Saprospiraceae bacterium]|jgi:hypothetical protein